jgi:hypothetical protein
MNYRNAGGNPWAYGHSPVAPTKTYRIMVTWHTPRGEPPRITCVAQSDNPCDLAEAPMVARNARSIARIELHDRTGCLETIWASHWVGYQRRDNPPPIEFALREPDTSRFTTGVK